VNVLRWIAVLPASFICGVLAAIIALAISGRMVPGSAITSMRVALATMALTLADCSVASREPLRPAAGFQSQHSAVGPVAQTAPTKRIIQIVSEPPGARIEVNDDYIGDAPCAIEVPSDSEGRFVKQMRIVAVPVAVGYSQSKIFRFTNDPIYKSDKIPSLIFFDMRLGSVWPNINVNVNQ
jgi:hypothetical protein